MTKVPRRYLGHCQRTAGENGENNSAYERCRTPKMPRIGRQASVTDIAKSMEHKRVCSSIDRNDEQNVLSADANLLRLERTHFSVSTTEPLVGKMKVNYITIAMTSARQTRNMWVAQERAKVADAGDECQLSTIDVVVGATLQIELPPLLPTTTQSSMPIAIVLFLL